MLNLKTILAVLALAALIFSAPAQEVSIPDPGLNAAIRDTLQKTNGVLTVPDLLSLTQLQAGNRNITNLTGLDAAANLTLLNLSGNSLTNFVLPNTLTNLAILDLSFNPLIQCVIPAGFSNLTTFVVENSTLTNLTLPAGLTGLTTLEVAFNNRLSSINLPAASSNLNLLDLGFNALTQCSLPSGLTKLDTLFLEGNSLTNFTLPPGLVSMTTIDLSANQLVNFALLPDMTNLLNVLIFANQLTNVTLPPNLNKFAGIDLDFNRLQNLNLPTGLTNFSFIEASGNLLTNVTFAPDLKNLGFIDLGDNQLPDLILPSPLNHLNFLRLSQNQLTNLNLPVGMTNLVSFILEQNPLTHLDLPSGLIRLVQLDITGTQLASLTLPTEATNLNTLLVTVNPFRSLVLSEPMASLLSDTILGLQNQGVSVSTFPLTTQLIAPRETSVGAFEFAVSAPPGVYVIVASTDLTAWTRLGVVTNLNGAVRFVDETSPLSPHKFYRALLQNVPANMVFIAPNTFTLGSPTNELGHQSDESPQTIVTLTHGFWISKFLVTQQDYLALTGTNPSGFPGDLNRPVESVSWPAATNYCALLTQQDLAAGRIPPGAHYRLPMEAEWECAARAGTSTRYYFGDDLDSSSLTNHAWLGANSGFVPHAVGTKPPNPSGLFDMEGNVWEWCQDWYGSYPGGAVTDPQGPDSSPLGAKVARGGAWESFESDCRSARRTFRGNSPFIVDFIIGFRVVLVTD